MTDLRRAYPPLCYITNVRLPTEKAHGLQIVQMCEAFSAAGYKVTLVVPRRRTYEAPIEDIWGHYGVARTFQIVKLRCWDQMWFGPRWLHGIAFGVQSTTFFVSAMFWLIGRPRIALIYSRDIVFHWLLSWLFADRKRIYEAHTTSYTRLGMCLEKRVLRSASLVIAVTQHLASKLRARGSRPIQVEHDGIRAERFARMPAQENARQGLGIPHNAFVAGYVGRLETLGMDKGVGTLVEACTWCYHTRPNWPGHLLIIGGPEDKAASLRAAWAGAGLPLEAFHAVGQIAAADVPTYLAACDVCVMPLPWTEHFAYYASPLKLFEYMAMGRPILATDLPAFREVLTEEETALLVPPSDPEAMGKALFRLADDPALRERLARNNRKAVQFYTWEARAHRIRDAINSLAENSA